MTSGGIKDYLKVHWPAIWEQLLNGTYEPKPVRRVAIGQVAAETHPGILECRVMENGLVSPSVEGTPQGGPLSPLLSNLLLNQLDRELERRGHRFVRYADVQLHCRSGGQARDYAEGLGSV